MTKTKPIPPQVKINETGNIYGRLTVLGYAGQNADGVYLWLCQCSCGKETTVRGALLRNGRTKSCGCLRHEVYSSTHGMAGKNRAPEYTTWANMKSRCSPQAEGQNRRDYFDRGIRVCERWLTFENFYADMGDKPTSKHTIERRNNALGYCPENCYWALRKVQNNNKRSNKMLTYNGRTQTLAAWCEELKLHYHTVKSRLNRGGHSIESAFTSPIATNVPHFRGTDLLTFNGETLTVQEWGHRRGFTRSVIRTRLRRGWPVEKILTIPVH